jgi:DNA (cytosine-5)-methyltransferase 1
MNDQLTFLDPPARPHATHSVVQEGNWADLFGKALRDQVQFQTRPKVLGLFSGAGGLDIGFHDVGFDIVETVEFEPRFVTTLNANTGPGRYFPNGQTNRCIDIRDYVPEFEAVDFIIGGPPCQSFSAAGARAQGVAGTRDERGGLFREYVRLLRLLKPRGFLFENVYRIVGANGGRDWSEIVQAFFDAGYDISARILDAADYGVPQHRERLIIVGVRKEFAQEVGYRFPRPTHGPDSETGPDHFSASAALAGLPQPRVNCGIAGRYGRLLDEIPPGLNYSFFTERMGHPRPIFAWRSKFSDFLYKADPARPVRTIKALGGQYTGPFHWDGRPFRVDELKRLQTFPDDYEICGGRGVQIQQIGNSVPPQLARILALSVAQQLFGALIPSRLSFLNPNEKLGFRNRKRNLTEHYEKLASRAIESLSDQAASIECINYTAALSADFSWVVRPDSGEHKFSIVERTVGAELHIELDECTNEIQGDGWHFYVHPRSEWVLPFTGVHLRTNSSNSMAFTAAWKAFEHFLMRNYLKADLVQLSNYYQYESAFQIEPLAGPHSNLAALLNRLARGSFVNEQLNLIDLAFELGVDENTAKNLLHELKRIGFEVRSNSTNAAIEADIYLIPYSFPTLTKMSVQRTKALAS